MSTNTHVKQAAATSDPSDAASELRPDEIRMERDSFGEIAVPAARLWVRKRSVRSRILPFHANACLLS